MKPLFLSETTWTSNWKTYVGKDVQESLRKVSSPAFDIKEKDQRIERKNSGGNKKGTNNESIENTAEETIDSLFLSFPQNEPHVRDQEQVLPEQPCDAFRDLMASELFRG